MRIRHVVTIAVGTLLGLGIAALLVTIVIRQQEARLTHFQIVEIPEDEPDPAVWGRNFPNQYEAYIKTLRTSELVKYSAYGRYGGSEAFSRLERHPDYVKIFAGYPFSVEYNEDRGHMSSLKDVLATKRLGDAKPGTCMTCHRQPEGETRARVLEAQARTFQLLGQGEKALTDAMTAIERAAAEGVTDEALAEARALHRRAQIRWDFISAENSMGFHSPQEAVRILGDAIDLARRAEISVLKASRPKR